MVLQHLPDGSYLSRLDGLERRIAGAKVVMTGADGTRIADSYRLITTLTDHRVYPAEALARLYYERRVWISSPMGGCGAALVKVMLAYQSCWSTRAGLLCVLAWVAAPNS